jgi:hypothetical protein
MFANNTRYKSNLDKTNHSSDGELVSRNANSALFVNNISFSWQTTNPPYKQENPLIPNTNKYLSNLYWGGPCWLGPGGTDFCSGNPQFINADPRFVAPPYFDGTATGQYATAEPPFLLGDSLTLQSTSPASCAGVDPSKVSGVPTQVAADMTNPSNVYNIYKDINGNPRPGSCAVGKFDLGAYQH